MKKRMWSPEEDQALKRYVEKHGPRNWNEVARLSGLQQRCPKSCRLRWMNFLRPGLKRGPFSSHDIRLLLSLHSHLGNRWSKIAAYMPGRSDNDVKNLWHTTSRRWRRTLHQLRSAQCTDDDQREPDFMTTQDHTSSSLESAERPNVVDPQYIAAAGKSGGSQEEEEELQQENKTSMITDTNLAVVDAPPEGLYLVVWSFMNRSKSPHLPLA